MTEYSADWTKALAIAREHLRKQEFRLERAQAEKATAEALRDEAFEVLARLEREAESCKEENQ